MTIGERARYRAPLPTPSVIGYLGVCLTTLFFSYLKIVDPVSAMALTVEDGWIENLTAISLFLAGFLLFATARMERNSIRRCIYVLGGLVMMFGAGEEISWGQRIFGFATPDILLDLNEQKEFNVHNMYGPYDNQRVLASNFLFVVALAAFFCRKDKLLEIPLPSIFLVLCFLASRTSLTHLDNNMGWIEYWIHFASRSDNALLLVLLFFTLHDRNWVISIAVIALLTFFFAHEYPNGNIYHFRALEVPEFHFSLACLLYAVELFRRFRIMDSTPRFQSREGSGGRRGGCIRKLHLPMNVRLSMINGTSALIIAGSIGLVVLGHFSPGTTAALIEKKYSRIKDAEPIIRSNFDVYLVENQLIYFKSPCAPSDRRGKFLLRIVPANPLPGVRQTQQFRHASPGWLDDTHPGGRCLSIALLPDYDIASISTGQTVGKVVSWKETFRFIE